MAAGATGAEAAALDALKRGGPGAAEALFEMYTTAELRAVERHLRAGIEGKREELRQMVGERYRDLIEAADTIAEMRLSAQQLLEAVRDLQQRRARARAGPPANPPAQQRAPGKPPAPELQEKFYCLAAQIQLLLQIPEKIWSAMESSQYLYAAQLYLLCCHLHGLLQLDTSGTRYSPILARFPILARQVAAATHFRCKEDIRSGITNLLVYVKSLKGLAGIRDAVWELLTSESISQNWEMICHRLLDKPISFWEDTLTKEGFDDISSSSRELLVLAVQELEAKSDPSAHNKNILFEHNMSSFLWSENPNDLPPDAAWISVANRSQFAKSGLSMKAQAHSPGVQSFCAALDSQLQAKLDDLLSYLPADSSLAKDSRPAQFRNSAFDRFADAGTVEELLRGHCTRCVHHVLGCVREELQGAQDVLRGCTDALHHPKINTVLFMARLCRSLGELCPHLKQCVLGKSGCLENVAREPWSSKKAGKGKTQEKNPVQAKWQELKEQLQQESLAAYRIWSTAVAQVLVHNFTQSLLKDEAGSILATSTNWEEIEIEEETESGSSVKSKIRLPVQPSWCVQFFLFSLCQEVNRVGGQTLPKITLQELLKTCMTEVLAGYEKLSEGKHEKKEGKLPITQNRALQLLYDLRYLNIILTTKSEDIKSSRNKQDSRIERQTDLLESYIDPFDLDVFTPHLNSNLNRLVQRTSVLFGLLTGTENQYGSRSSALTSQEQHNILPLTSSQIRFGLLPLSMSSSRKTKSTQRNSEHTAQCDGDQ
ncbi:hypothetical protein JRQ81_002003 [Phrynocephalus forsythii]|uniref:Conserved oligomeric Golgi complex subunit 1 n=1 Tax=Phrynocephalus forsythii TaxID=171643 RepID=A0A9Q1AVT6_9SAUR|nr:hypothetical protein JRQ81_002003 [Phrynocephalus forsythii]